MPSSQNHQKGLTRSDFVTAAFDLLHSEGADAFSMRALGMQLGVSAMACYAHFSNKDEVLSEVLALLMSKMDTDEIPGEYWEDTIRRTMRSIHAVYQSYPQVALACNSPVVQSAGLKTHTKKVIALHLRQGIPPEVLAHAWALIDAYLTGFEDSPEHMVSVDAGVESNEACTSSGDTCSDGGEFWEMVVRKAYTEESFNSGIEMILAGIRSLAPDDYTSWRSPQ